MQITFFGAARTVTGSKHLVTTDFGVKILLDCGLFQGIGTHEMNQTFGFDPASIDYVILSHAHIDHTGLLPRLIAKGFNGPIYCTGATADLAELLLGDSAHIQETDIERQNKRRVNRGEAPLELLYTQTDVEVTLALMRPMRYNVPFEVCEGVICEFNDAGHIMGSASVNLDLLEQDGSTVKFSFTGDIGRPNDSILKNPDCFRQADYIVCESTYGNKLHPAVDDVKAELLRIVNSICVEKGGKICIPAFSVGRTQEIVYMLDQLETEGKLPKIPIYVDSPLSVKATDVIRKHKECYNDSIARYVRIGDGDAFAFDHLQYISSREDSKALSETKGPCIIISASGMAEAGRIKHHIFNNLGDPNSAVLFVGYCSPQGLGGQLKSGAKEVKIFGEMHEVKCQVFVADSFSAHADYTEMLQFLACQDPKIVQKMFLVHGELENQEAWAKRLNEAGFASVEIPELGQSFILK
jgi:metallo-beta-lactamase family protein